MSLLLSEYPELEFDVQMVNPGMEISPYSEAPIWGKILSQEPVTGNYVSVSNIRAREGSRWYIKHSEGILVEKGNVVYLIAANRTQTAQFIDAGSVVGRARII